MRITRQESMSQNVMSISIHSDCIDTDSFADKLNTCFETSLNCSSTNCKLNPCFADKENKLYCAAHKNMVSMEDRVSVDEIIDKYEELVTKVSDQLLKAKCDLVLFKIYDKETEGKIDEGETEFMRLLKELKTLSNVEELECIHSKLQELFNNLSKIRFSIFELINSKNYLNIKKLFNTKDDLQRNNSDDSLLKDISEKISQDFPNFEFTQYKLQHKRNKVSLDLFESNETEKENSENSGVKLNRVRNPKMFSNLKLSIKNNLWTLLLFFLLFILQPIGPKIKFLLGHPNSDIIFDKINGHSLKDLPKAIEQVLVTAEAQEIDDFIYDLETMARDHLQHELMQRVLHQNNTLAYILHLPGSQRENFKDDEEIFTSCKLELLADDGQKVRFLVNINLNATDEYGYPLENIPSVTENIAMYVSAGASRLIDIMGHIR